MRSYKWHTETRNLYRIFKDWNKKEASPTSNPAVNVKIVVSKSSFFIRQLLLLVMPKLPINLPRPRARRDKVILLIKTGAASILNAAFHMLPG